MVVDTIKHFCDVNYNNILYVIMGLLVIFLIYLCSSYRKAGERIAEDYMGQTDEEIDQFRRNIMNGGL